MRVLSIACDSSSIASIASTWRPFCFIFNRGTEKVRWVGDESHVVFGQIFPGEKGTVRSCVVVMQQRVLLSPKSGVKTSHIFTQWP
jgi:hypothetical protein